MNQYIITEEMINEILNLLQGEKYIEVHKILSRSNPYNPQAERDKVLNDIFAPMDRFFGNIPMDAHIIQWAVSKQDSFVTAAMATYLTLRKLRKG